MILSNQRDSIEGKGHIGESKHKLKSGYQTLYEYDFKILDKYQFSDLWAKCLKRIEAFGHP